MNDYPGSLGRLQITNLMSGGPNADHCIVRSGIPVHFVIISIQPCAADTRNRWEEIENNQRKKNGCLH